MREVYKKFKDLTGFTYQDMGNRVGVSRQHIQASMTNHSMIYKTSMAAVMSVCINEKICELEKHIDELKAFRQEILLDAVNNSYDSKDLVLQENYKGEQEG